MSSKVLLSVCCQPCDAILLSLMSIAIDNLFSILFSKFKTSFMFLIANVPITIILKPSLILDSIASLLLMPPATSI